MPRSFVTTSAENNERRTRLLKVATETKQTFLRWKGQHTQLFILCGAFFPSFLTYILDSACLLLFTKAEEDLPTSHFRLSTSRKSEAGRPSSALVNFTVLAKSLVFRRLWSMTKELLLSTIVNYLTQCSSHAVVAALLSLT